MGKTKVLLPFGGCASSEAAEVRMPKWWIPALWIGLGLAVIIAVWGLSQRAF